MKIECGKEVFAKAVGILDKVTGKNLTLPVLSCILIEAKESSILLRATNLDLIVEFSVKASVSEKGIIAVPGNLLNSFISTIGSIKTITLSIVNGNLLIQTPVGRATIKAFPHDDFPTLKKPEGKETFITTGSDFSRGLQNVYYGANQASLKPELASVFFHHRESFLVFAATDSYRLAEKLVKVKNDPIFDPTLIPLKNVTDIIRILSDQNSNISFYVSKNQISCVGEGLLITSRVIDGAFPDYQAIIPRSASTEISLLKEDFSRVLKIANVFSNKFNQLTITVSPKRKECVVAASNADTGEADQKVAITGTGEDVVLSFNFRYLTDSFNSISADSLSLSLNGPGKPLVMRGAGDRSFLYLVMPMSK